MARQDMDFLYDTIKKLLDKSNANFEDLYNENDQRKVDITTLINRVNLLTSLPEGSTSGDAELTDIRVDYKGITHETVGNAMREADAGLDLKFTEELSNLHKLLSEQISDLGSTVNDIIQVDRSTNILGVTDYTVGRYYSASTGEYRDSENNYTVDNFIEVDPSTSYVLSEFINGVFQRILSTIIIFYDKNKVYLSGGQYSVFTTPVEARYIRLSFNTSELTRQLLLETGKEPSKVWVPYYKSLRINNDKIIDLIYDTLKDKPILNGVEISGNKSLEDYGILSESSFVSSYNLYKLTELTVDTNGTGDFRTLQDALASIKDNSMYNRYVIYIKEGTYNLAEGITDGETSSEIIGVTIPNWVTLKGLGNKENIILKAAFNTSMRYVSTLNFKETCGIENLTIIGDHTRYTIHDDFARNSVGYKRIVKNCIIKGISTYYSTVYGSGTGDGADWYFENVIFDGSEVGSGKRPANTFTVHNYLGSKKNRSIIFKNCRFISTNDANVKLKTLAYRASNNSDSANNMITTVQFIGCKFGGVTKGFELVEENASVYGSGCYYSVSGYSNVGATYDITTTDGKDYSNRVDLI